MAALDRSPGAIPALPGADTLKRGDDGIVTATVDRHNLWRTQTPQGFRYGDILAAHRQAAGDELTDDAAVAERAGLAVAIVDGAEDNIKVTTPDDLSRAERLLSAAGGEIRTSLGLDAHRFGPGDHDADVGLHAVTDALLGTIGAGDIGSHFPPSDPNWKDAPSDLFLRRAGELLAERGGRISNLDVTLVCEQPKIGSHRQAMAARIAEILGIDEGRVSVKATTTDKLGFCGRGEGIAAQAVATVVLG